MLKIELFKIITNGKNSGAEFKRDDVYLEQFAKEIVVRLLRCKTIQKMCVVGASDSGRFGLCALVEEEGI